MSAPLTPLVRRLFIVTKQLQTVRLASCLNWAQLALLNEVERSLTNGERTRIIVLKARQLGVSTIIEAIQFTLAFLLPGVRGLVVSHETDSATHLLEITNHYWKTAWFRQLYSLKNDSARRLTWNETNSSIRVATAKNVGAGRSQTLQFLHGSEVGFWQEARTLMTGLNQSIPQHHLTFQFLESTANGIGNYFYDAWNSAVDGDSEYTPLFFPWHKHPEYSGRAIGYTTNLGKLDEEERVLSRLGIDNDRLVWRRWAIQNNCEGDIEKFHQEYPTTPEEAFVATGRNVFPIGKLNLVYKPMTGLRGRLVWESNNRVRFQEDATGPLTIFKYPAQSSHGSYFLAGDPTRTNAGDPACAQVLNRYTWEQVATFHDRIDAVTFGEEMFKLGLYYNTAYISCEIQGAGGASISYLLSHNYPYVWMHQKAEKMPGMPDTSYGWWSTTRTKGEAIGNLLKLIVDGDITIHHRRTYAELRNFVSLGNGQYGNSSEEEHDDTVMALAICVTCMLYESHELLVKTSMGETGPQASQGRLEGNMPREGLPEWAQGDAPTGNQAWNT